MVHMPLGRRIHGLFGVASLSSTGPLGIRAIISASTEKLEYVYTLQHTYAPLSTTKIDLLFSATIRPLVVRLGFLCL